MDGNRMKTDYMKKDTRLGQFFPYPQYLLKLDISGTSKLLYAMFMHRATLSQKNAWVDEEGRVYIIYTIEAIAADMGKSRSTVKHSLAELCSCGLLERRPAGFGNPNHLYVKIPEGSFSDGIQAEDLPSNGAEKGLQEGQVSASPMAEKPAPNYIKNKYKYNKLSGVIDGCAAYGRYQNIYLSDAEYERLGKDYPDKLPRFIEEMSNYLAATGKSYANYEAGIRMWASKDRQEPSEKSGSDDYSFKEGESY